MEKLSIHDIILKIEKQELFEAVSEDYSFTLKIDSYLPYVCAAVHDGHQFRKELWDNCLHTEYERWYEEDPATKQMIQSHPIVIAGMDSRFEYDLNRPPQTAIYKDAWKVRLWKSSLSYDQRKKSLEKHANFYKVVHALIGKLEEKFSTCIVYDMHSYNWQRWDRKVPTWNLGTINVDNYRFSDDIESWRKILGKTPFPNEIESSSKVNDTFQGNGYFLKYITTNFKNTLVLATEIAKVYCNELEQILYPEVVSSVEEYLKLVLPEHAESFYKKHKK
ncbi:N-formylglutamate amidohydrolase [Tenacibaculum sp. MAR_2009_124]|uniref:N-formylglutamate amidohydrolase n=1 Tax=Tenacibaculum sp. MAR_2009_124 TaxID=1250059 RepID=UPI00089BF57E|nr:N-formylglutamate amidohydrolase [Tenacibaculum sp. MAR_2009_124]SEB49163.1 N-formylglutamate amidohydrolase [Tenacibaculum sp. MAR_2009_124]